MNAITFFDHMVLNTFARAALLATTTMQGEQKTTRSKMENYFFLFVTFVVLVLVFLLLNGKDKGGAVKGLR